MSKVSTINGNRSLSLTSCNSSASDFEDGNTNRLIISPGQSRSRPTSSAKNSKAKRVRFFHNGNKFFGGIVVPVTNDRYRSFDSLISDLTDMFMKNVTLPSGVRNVYTIDGRKVSTIDELEDGKEYVCAGKGDTYKRLEYAKISLVRNKRTTVSKVISPAQQKVTSPDCIHPRIVTIIRSGHKPRKVIRLLLNKRNATSLEQVLRAVTEVAQLDSGAVRKVFTRTGQLVIELKEFFENEDLFFVYGNERFSQEDFDLELEEHRIINSYKKTTTMRNGGPVPKMPKKQVEKVHSTDETDILCEIVKSNNKYCLPSPLREKYEMGVVIGDGNFSVVKLCKEKTTGNNYAMKIIDKSKCKGKEGIIENEVSILEKMDHPHIMMLFDQYDTDLLLYLIVEYVDGGDLFDAISAAQKYSEEQAALMITHLSRALVYLHNLNIVHRDVKPENLLVKFGGDQIRTLKLGDFGLACQVEEPLYTVCGTPTYVAPEILAESGYGLKIDIWAAGVILYILLCGFPPFVTHDDDQEKLFDSILTGQYEFREEYWSGVSDSAKELIQNMLQLAPDLRFSAEDILDYHWLQYPSNF